MRRIPVAAALLAALAVAAPAPAAYAPRIVGGSVAQITTRPYQVALVDARAIPPTYTPADGQFCGGSVRDATHVITAGHCVFDGQTVTPASHMYVFAGATDIDSDPGQKADVESVSFVPTFDENGDLADDAAVLTLKQPLDLSASAVKAIPLIDHDTESSLWVPGDTATVSGWGLLGYDPNNPNDPSTRTTQLHQVAVPVISDSACNTTYAPAGGIVGPVMVCAGSQGKDSCFGDSGGPLTVSAGTGAVPDRLIGIVSFGVDCGTFPGVYTEVDNTKIRSFVTTPVPTPAPANTTAPSASGTLKPGETLTCDPGTWTGSPAFRYQFGRVNSLSDTAPAAISPIQTSTTYTITSADAGRYLLCAVEGRNAGGREVLLSRAVGPVESPPAATPPTTTTPAPTPAAIVPQPQLDTTPPVSHLFRATCGKTSCRLNVLVEDAPFSLGVQKLEVTVRTSYKVRCRRGRHVRRCARVQNRTLTATELPAHHFLVLAPHLRRGTHTFRIVATDTAGNRERKALRVTLRTPAP